jgi:hypothetical protein
MPLNIASPGIVVREVDLTVGRINPSANLTAGIVAPFERGPVNVPTTIETEQDLLKTFGQPYSIDNHYENWYVASSYLSYGGNLQVVRANDSDLKNASYPSGDIKIESDENYVQLGYSENIISNIGVVARNPGSWANDIKFAVIDGKADQILTGVTTTGGIGGTLSVGMGVTQAISSTLAGIGTTTSLDGYLKGIITEIGNSTISVKVLSHVSAGGTVTDVDYGPGGVYSFAGTGSVAIHTVGNTTAAGTTSYTAQSDWFDQQYVEVSDGSKIYWNTVADRPSTSNYATSRLSRFDELHILVLDNTGSITGSAGNIIEKHLNLSKGSDAEYSLGSPSYWRRYLELGSDYIFGGSGAALGITTITYSSEFTLSTGVSWDKKTAGNNFGACGSISATLSGGKNYNGSSGLTTSGALNTSVLNLAEGYDLLANGEDLKIDFLLMGSANYTKENAQSLAQKLIQVADSRKDCIAFISPYRNIFLNDSVPGTITINSADTITNLLIAYFNGITSSSYAVFDSSYKYVYDKYGDVFRYIPLNGDIAGLCARNDINNFPWFSPAGTSRGTISNAIKLAYNPSKLQRDKLYSSRINPVVFSPGSGIVLFGDKTALSKPSAFDRINVRRLFIYIQRVISEAAKDQLFEFNDEITRTNFVNVVEPFLRDIQAKRGINDFRVICDESNNTASVIDNNEFIADIYVKPTRSINYIGLTFVATRTGVNFDEIIGTV